jgi:hypothetical protein
MVTFKGQNCNSNSKLSILVHSEIKTLDRVCIFALSLRIFKRHLNALQCIKAGMQTIFYFYFLRCVPVGQSR